MVGHQENPPSSQRDGNEQGASSNREDDIDIRSSPGDHDTTKTTAPLMSPPQEGISHNDSAKRLSARHAFAVLVSLQIGSGIFSSPAQVDSNVPSPGAALLIWLVGGLLSWAGAASFAEFGAALPLNGGMQEYLRYVYGDTVAFLMAWIYIFAAKPSAMAIQCIVLVDSAVSALASADSTPLASWQLKLLAISAHILIVLFNSISTKTTMRLNESFTIFKLATVTMIAFGGICVLIAHIFDPNSSLSGATDWYSKNWFHSRPSVSDGFPIEWTNIGWWELLGHYSAALYAGLWAYDGWDNVSLFYITLQYHVFFRTTVDSATVPNIGQNHPEGAMSRKNCVMSCSISNNIPPSTIVPSSVPFAYCT
jgi:solute carrier family 7 (L-type amino acid transporter), member 9/15